MTRFWWASDTDMTKTKARLDSLKSGQFSSWSWSQWSEPLMSKSEMNAQGLEAPHLDLIRNITMKSVFDDGRVIVTYGIPDFQDKLAPELKNIPEGVLFVLVAKPEKNLTLYKKAKELEKAGLAKIDEVESKTTGDIIKFIKERAKQYGADIDQMSCKMLVDFVGHDENMLDQELRKFSFYTDNITPLVVEEGCFADGASNITDLPDSITYDSPNLQEMLRRGRNDNPNEDQFLTLFLEWAQKLCIAESLGRNIDKLDKEKVGAFKKKPVGKSISMAEFNAGKTSGTPGKLIANLNSLYYSCKSLNESGRKPGWGYVVLEQLGVLYLKLRTTPLKEDRDKLWQQFVIWANGMPKRLEE